MWQRRGGGARGPINRSHPGRRYQDRQGGKARQPSVQVRQDWVVLEELDFHRLNKLYLPDIKPGQDMCVFIILFDGGNLAK